MASMNTNEFIWNAQVSYRFLKRRAATISLQAFDLLHQRSNISRQISAYSRSDTETNAINSYVMCHFIYRLNLFGSRDARQSMRRSFDVNAEGGERGVRDGEQRSGEQRRRTFTTTGGRGMEVK